MLKNTNMLKNIYFLVYLFFFCSSCIKQPKTISYKAFDFIQMKGITQINKYEEIGYYVKVEFNKKNRIDKIFGIFSNSSGKDYNPMFFVKEDKYITKYEDLDDSRAFYDLYENGKIISCEVSVPGYKSGVPPNMLSYICITTKDTVHNIITETSYSYEDRDSVKFFMDELTSDESKLPLQKAKSVIITKITYSKNDDKIYKTIERSDSKEVINECYISQGLSYYWNYRFPFLMESCNDTLQKKEEKE